MALALNYLIAFLLLITILYCWRLNKRIVELHKGKKELLTLLKAFDQSIIRAEEGTKTLKHTCANIGKSLQEDIDKARFLVEDLNFMIDRAASATDKLEKYIQASRQVERPMTSSAPAQAAAFPPPRPSFNDPIPQASSRIPPRVSINSISEPPNPMPTAKDNNSNKSKRSSIELLLEKLAGRKETASSNKAATTDKRIPYMSPAQLGAFDMNATSSTSKAESDLLKLLKSTH